MRTKFFLGLVAVAFVAYAGQKAYVGLTNRQPTRMTCAEFASGQSGAKWVVLTNCELDVENAIGLQSRVLKIDKGVYVPVRPAGSDGPAPILLKTDSEDASVGISDTHPGADAAPTGPAERRLRIHSTISGLVESGFDTERKTRRALDKVAREGTIRDDYVVIAAGKKPDAFDTVMGIVILATTVLVIALWIRSKRIQAAQRAAASTPPPLPPQ